MSCDCEDGRLRTFFKKAWHWLWGFPWSNGLEEREERVMREVRHLTEIHKARKHDPKPDH